MSGPFLCYRECIPPTSIDTAKFFTCAGYGDFLITLTSGAISIYRVHLSSKDGGHGAHFSLVLHLKVFGKPFDVNIFNPSEFTGDESGNAPDQCYVILNFDSGKISISKFDPSRCSLEIAALFNAEEEAIGAGSEVHALTQGRQISPGVGSSPFLIVDIQDSIACTLLYGQQLFFVDLSSFGDHDSNGISIMNPSVLLQSKLGVAQGKADSSSKQFIVDIQLSLRLLGPVLDYCFLPGYSHPALAVLQERGPLPAGHAATTRHTCCLSVLAVDKVTQTVSLLWRQLMLPHDSICIVPLIQSSDFGSIALITMNAVLLVSQEGVTGVSTCGFASTTVSSHITLQPSKLPTGLELDASRWIESDRGCLVGSLKDGRLMSVKFQTSESPVKDIFFSVSLIASSIRCSCFCMNVSGKLWFLGSRLSDCLLISVTQPPSGSLDPSHSIPLDSMKLLTGTSSSAKRVKRMSFDHSSSSSNSDFFCGDDCSVAVRDNIDEEESNLYGKILNPHLSNLNKIGAATNGTRTLTSTSTPASSSSSALSLYNSDVGTESLLCTKYSLKVTDTIPVLGPVLDGMFCGNDESIDQLDRVEWDRVGMPLSKTMPNPASAYIVDREAKDSLHLYTGLDEESGIYRVARGIRVSKLASRNFPGATGVHCLPASNRLYSLLFINFLDKSRLFLCHTSGLSKMTEDPIIPDNSLDKVFLPSDLSLKEISCADAGFIATEATIAIGMLVEFVAVQVVSQCVRVVIMSAESGANGEALQDVFVCDDIELGGLGGSPGEHIVYADVCRSWVSLITSVGAVYLLEFDPSDETLVLRHSVQDFQSSSIGSKGGLDKNEDEDGEKEVGEGRLREDVSAMKEDIEGQGLSHALPSLSTLLTLSPIAASLFYGAFPTPSSSSTTASSTTVTSGKTTTSTATSSASSSSSASEWAGTSQALDSSPSIVSQTPGQGQKNLNQQKVFETPSSSVSLSLSLPRPLPLPDTSSKIQVLSALQKFKKAEALYLYGDSSFDCYTSSEEHESLDSDTQDPQNGEVTQNHVDRDRMEVVVDGDEEGYTEFSRSENAYETPGKRKQNDNMEIDDSQVIVEMEVKNAIESMHVVFSDQYGTVKVIALDSLRCVFQADNICSLPKLIPLKYEPSDVSNDKSEGVGSPTPNTPHTPHTPNTPRPPASTPTAGSTTLDPTTETAPRAFRATERVLVDARLVMLGRTSAPSSLAKLTFVLVLESSDVVVYYLADQYRPDLKKKVSMVPRDAFFIKLEHAVVTRKRKNRLRKRNPAFNINDATGATNKEYLREADDLCPQRIRVHHTDERTTVLVSGSRPVMICNDSGIPFLAPLGTPDLPFSNNGAYLLAPLSVGKIQGVASMWVENDDGFPPVPTGLSAAVTESKKQSTLQLYQEVPGLLSYPGSVTTAKKMHSGVTTHHCVELLAKSEDNTEQALLKNRTFVLACSTEIKIPFLSAVLTDDEKDKEEKFYDRFFPSLESFTQPDPLVGAAPDMTTREHKLVIMQSGTAVDEYVLPAGEQVLGIEALYLTVTTSTVIPALFTPQAIVMEKKTKRVFFAACTCVEDKHGEDTQGEGRIMFFGLDYALFQDAVGDSNAAAEVKEIEEIVDGKSNTSAPSSSSSSSSLQQSKPQQAASTQPQTKSQQSSEQAKFFKAIQPKLKLLWTGPGPASIVKQIGEYILSTVSTTVYVYKLNSETMELDQITFFFAQFFISSISVMKNYIVIADVCNSIQFLVWREDDLTLTLVSKDMDSQTVLSTAFLSDGGSLGIVVGDDEANIQLMKFDPSKLETKDGSRLCCLADFHLGSDATLLLPHSMLMSPALLPVSLPRVLMTQPPLPPMPPPMPQMGLPLSLSLVPPPLPPQSMPPSRVARLRQSATSAVGQPFGQKLDKFSGTKSCVLVGTIDGGLGMLMPVEERMYRRLALLQQIMGMGVPTPCGLNPREYRVIRTTRFVTEKKKGILDGTLLWKYVSLESSLQDELAAAMGVTTDTILESLLELDLLGSFF